MEMRQELVIAVIILVLTLSIMFAQYGIFRDDVSKTNIFVSLIKMVTGG